jgi:hypothetical protein
MFGVCVTTLAYMSQGHTLHGVHRRSSRQTEVIGKRFAPVFVYVTHRRDEWARDRITKRMELTVQSRRKLDRVGPIFEYNRHNGARKYAWLAHEIVLTTNFPVQPLTHLATVAMKHLLHTKIAGAQPFHTTPERRKMPVPFRTGRQFSRAYLSTRRRGCKIITAMNGKVIVSSPAEGAAMVFRRSAEKLEEATQESETAIRNCAAHESARRCSAECRLDFKDTSHGLLHAGSRSPDEFE